MTPVEEKRRREAIRIGAEALRYTARGWSNADAARALFISEESVKSRLARFYRLIGARNATHAVSIAAVEGLLTREDIKAAVQDRRLGWVDHRKEE